VEIEEANCRCKIDNRSRIPSLLGSNSRSPRTHIPTLDITGETMVLLIHCDLNGALSTIRSTITSDKVKYIDVPFHNSRHLDTAGVVKFTEIDTLENLADVMTKAIPLEKH